jgi:hypothetical protein
MTTISKILIVCRKDGKIDDATKCFMLKEGALRYCGSLPEAEAQHYIIKNVELVYQ